MTNKANSNARWRGKRRDLLSSIGKGTAVVNLASLGSPTKAAALVEHDLDIDSGVDKTATQFINFNIIIPEPDDALLVGHCEEFPRYFRSGQRIYLPLLQPSPGDGVVLSTMSGLSRMDSQDGVVPIPSTQIVTNNGNLLTEPDNDTDVLASVFEHGISLQVGTTETIVGHGESMKLIREEQTEYRTSEGLVNETIETTYVFEHHDVDEVISHSDLILIPKESPGGVKIEESLKPRLEQHGSIGNWSAIYDLTSIDAWGIARTPVEVMNND